MMNFPLGSGLYGMPDEQQQQPSPFAMGSGLYGQQMPPPEYAPPEAAAAPGAAPAAKGGFNFEDLINNPMFQMGMALVSSRGPGAFGNALQSTLQMQAVSKRGKQGDRKLDLEAQQQAQQAAQQDRSAGQVDRRLTTDETQGNRRLDLSQLQGEQSYDLGVRGANTAERAAATGERNADTNASMLKDVSIPHMQAQTAHFTTQDQLDQAKLAAQQRQTQMVQDMFGIDAGGGGGAPVPAGVPGVPGSVSSTNLSNNNFGNIRPPGASTGFMKYDTPEAGKQAIADNLSAYATKHGINTIAGAASRWVGGGADGDSPMKTAEGWSKMSGIPVDQPVDFTDPKVQAVMIPAIAQQEHGAAAIKVAEQSGVPKKMPDPMKLIMAGAITNNPALVAAGNAMKPDFHAPGSVVTGPQGEVKGMLPNSPLEERRVVATEKNAESDAVRAGNDTAKRVAEVAASDKKIATDKANSKVEFNSINSSLDRLGAATTSVMNHPGLEHNTGWYGAIGLNKIPNSDANDARVQIEGLKNKLVVDTLADLKKASANGSSGFGQLSEQENKRLEGYVTNLQSSTSLKQTRSSLKQIQDFVQSAKKNYTDRYNSLYGGDNAQQQQDGGGGKFLGFE